MRDSNPKHAEMFFYVHMFCSVFVLDETCELFLDAKQAKILRHASCRGNLFKQELSAT